MDFIVAGPARPRDPVRPDLPSVGALRGHVPPVSRQRTSAARGAARTSGGRGSVPDVPPGDRPKPARDAPSADAPSVDALSADVPSPHAPSPDAPSADAASPGGPPSLTGLLAAAVDGIGGTARPGQDAMAEAVWRAIGTGEHLAVQAGTGTGKSLAYLVPAAAHAIGGGASVVVATATI